MSFLLARERPYVEAPPAPIDEAASDPPSPEAVAPPSNEGPPIEGGVGSDPMSVSLPGESMDGSYHSEELLMDDVEGHPASGHVSAIFLEEEMPTGHDDNEGYMEADEDPLALGFDIDWAVGEGEEEHAPHESQEDLPFVKSWAVVKNN